MEQPLDPATKQRLAAFEGLVAAWAPRLDLVSTADEDRRRITTRHIKDSLRGRPLVAKLTENHRAIDVGSGAGFPGVPLAIVHPQVTWTFLEPRRRRAAFLEEVVRTLELSAEVAPVTAEAAARAGGADYHLATARALAAPERAFGLLAPLLVPGGVAAVWVGVSSQVPSQAVEGPPGIATMKRPRP